MARILIVEDEPNMRKVLSANLRQDGHILVEAATVKEGLQAVYGNDFDVVLLDQKMPDGEGSEVLKAVQQSEPSTAVVMLSAYGTVELAVEAMRNGAFDFLTKPFSPDNLRAVVHRAAERAFLHRENYLLRNTVDRLEGQTEIRGNSLPIVKLRELISRVGPTGATVLITGETGTGKELVARAIHKSSQRASKPLISVNCAAFSESLLESELFGHERGAFTGADRTRHGLFEAAHEGTLFLDEAGEMSAAAQAKLLRVLAEGKITRVGSTISRDVDVRVLAATHRDLRKEVQEGNFRQDLYYRLAIVPIAVPALRDRIADIPEVAQYLLHQIASDLKTTKRTLHPDALQQLMSYNFPGNVRELRNLLERACILTSSPEILWFDLPEVLPEEALAESGLPAFNGASLPDEFHLRSTLASWERRIIEQTLVKTNGSKTEAARRLGLSKSDLSYKLSKYGL
ncbi:sigma-54-dependent transcriptional regulator [Edaphobacter flagellatus]|jgi:DNA-binding NtrC family response regulator|uniref:sigma-54-dependent transcriptional regulator n=1 Tax=Edaphobacter flagellatus TaxID=1933044 RepID=UPI0021B324C6|nr:sigma-54 dependent transcriptional regulator [Edaphobacter flagellatus]HZY71977.1 sigma-54 dependent transcriptional regulator [Edaphobacter sp.]